MFEDENLLFPDEEEINISEDSIINKMQMNLIMMGFDIEMVNKVISIFKIKTEEEAIDYLIKSENGMWNHPFIPKEQEAKEEKKFVLEPPKNVMNNVLSKINTIKLTSSFSQKADDSINDINENDINNDNDTIKTKEEEICEICGESKDFHIIKEFKSEKNDDNLNSKEEENKSFDDINNDDENANLIIENKDEDNNKKENEEIKEEQEQEKEEEIEPNPGECKICMGEIENPVEIENCKHIFCQECFHSYLVNLITNNQIDTIPCPKNKCKNKNISEIFFSQFLTEQEYFKYRQFKAQNEIARDKKKIFCPLCDSYADIGDVNLASFDSNSPDYIKTTLKCKNGHDFCSCGRPIHEGKCYQDEDEFKDFVINEKIKKCPKCGFLIKKTQGCNHMICGNPICKYEFCWLCMQESVPNHFDYGPCAGKQFYDPDSFLNQLKINYPFLYIIACFFIGIALLILFIICCMAIPGLAFAIIFFGLIFTGDLVENVNSKAKIIIFFGYFFYGFALQSLIYMAWGIFFGAVGICFVALILGMLIAILKFICKCLFFCFDDNNDANVPQQNNNNNNNFNNIIDELF